MMNPPTPFLDRFYQPAAISDAELETAPGRPAQALLRQGGPPIILRWPALHLSALPEYIRVRVTVGLPGYQRGAQSGAVFEVEAFLPGSADGPDGGDLPLRLFDIRYPVSGQTFEITIDQGIARQAAQVGLGLRLSLTNPPASLAIWTGAGAPPYQAPHLLCDVDVAPLDAFYAQLLAPVAAEGAWTGPALLETGAILHGLLDLAEAGVIDRAAAIDGCTRWIDSFGTLAGDREGDLSGWLLCNGLRARVQAPPMPGLALPTWVTDRIVKQCTAGPHNAEDAFALAYPLALVAHLSGRAETAALALRVIAALRHGLWHGENRQGPHFFRRLAEDPQGPDDARALGWYALGIARSLAVLTDRAPNVRADIETYADMQAHFRDVMQFILDQQTAAGLWPAEITDRTTPLDTTASAALCAALVIGYTHHLTERRFVREAGLAVALLRQYLTPDGLLTGALQALPEGDLLLAEYGVISRTAIGLLAQALAPSRAFR
jgi:hypothetical protein